jgi:hypothetical protein
LQFASLLWPFKRFGKLKVTIIDHSLKWYYFFSLIPFGDKVLSFLIQKLSLSCLLLSSHLRLWSIMVTFGRYLNEFGYHAVFKNMFDSAVWYINQIMSHFYFYFELNIYLNV